MGFGGWVDTVGVRAAGGEAWVSLRATPCLAVGPRKKNTGAGPRPFWDLRRPRPREVGGRCTRCRALMHKRCPPALRSEADTCSRVCGPGPVDRRRSLELL